MAAPVFVHGKLGTVSLNGSLFAALSINFQEATTLTDITYTVAGGATAQIMLPGYKKASGSITFVYDTANQPSLSPYDMRPAQGINPSPLTAIFYPEGTKPWTCSIYPESLQFTTGPTTGPVNCTMAFQSTGAITEPTS